MRAYGRSLRVLAVRIFVSESSWPLTRSHPCTKKCVFHRICSRANKSLLLALIFFCYFIARIQRKLVFSDQFIIISIQGTRRPAIKSAVQAVYIKLTFLISLSWCSVIDEVRNNVDKLHLLVWTTFPVWVETLQFWSPSRQWRGKIALIKPNRENN